MATNRVENAKRNLLFGILNRIVFTLVPFLSRTVLIYVLGMEYVGLNELLVSVLQVLNLADLGIGSAIVYALYEPVANDDRPTIRALMNYYRRVYHAIGLVIAMLGLVLMPFLPHLIKGEPPADVNLYVLYLVYLANTVFSYLLFAYKQALPTAMQRVDVVSNVNTITTILLNLAQVVLLLIFRNYYAFLFVIPVFTIVNNILMSIHVDKTYPDYKPEGMITKELRASIRKRVFGLSIQRVCATTRNTFDNMVLSAFIGLVVTGKYGTYLLVMNAVTGILAVVTTSILPTVGNSIVTDSTDKNYNDMRLMNSVYMLIAGFCASCMLSLYQPFMRIWTGAHNMLGFEVVALLVIYFYGLKMGDIISLYASGAGLWWEMRWRAIAETILNVALNLIFVQIWGVAGVVASTIVSIFAVNFILASRIIFKHYFKNGKLGEYYFDQIRYLLVTAVVCAISYLVCSHIPEGGLLWLLVRGLACAAVTVLLYLLLYSRSSKFRETMGWFLGVLKPQKKAEKE